MPTLSFEGETQAELVTKVRRWLNSLEGEERLLTPAEAIVASADLTKDALKVIASAAPKPVAESEVVKGLTAMGYQVTDATSKAMVDALDSLSNLTGDRVVKRVREGSQSALYEMNQAVAKQVLKSFRPTRRK
jgi:chemotaxis protein histidine kinase CheA